MPGDDARLEREIETIGAALAEVVRDPGAIGALEAILRYLLATHRQLTVEKASKLLEKAAGPEVEEAIMTELDEIERRGELRGERRGERRGAKQAARRILLQQMAARFGVVPDEIVAQVEAAGESTLLTWTLRVLTAATPEDVIAGAGRPVARRSPPARKPATPARAARAATIGKRRA